MLGCSLAPPSPPFARTSDYVRQGQARLKEQASAAASQVVETASTMATDAGEKIAAKSSELLDTAKDKATRLSHDMRDQVAA